ncbi:MAG: D-tyrosyl-tRNA(Tyr) deacylase [Oscillospiraceae bacterium]|jgi:D-tyrosyl-tRNA(Tyr) deacylase|nr:D-tyrosyl-tRNA(Tyr) deacylase [Oscillospiraceae bacterium]
MRAVVTRVKSASVEIEGSCVGRIGQGLLILLGVGQNDSSAQCRKLAEKVLSLRIFCDSEGKMNRSLSDIEGAVLVVSQFTLYGDCRKGRRPSFVAAGAPESANALYEEFLSLCAAQGFAPQHGQFGADMLVSSENDGPVTLILDTDDWM